jgi:hypothetical protein
LLWDVFLSDISLVVCSRAAAYCKETTNAKETFLEFKKPQSQEAGKPKSQEATSHKSSPSAKTDKQGKKTISGQGMIPPSLF